MFHSPTEIYWNFHAEYPLVQKMICRSIIIIAIDCTSNMSLALVFLFWFVIFQNALYYCLCEYFMLRTKYTIYQIYIDCYLWEQQYFRSCCFIQKNLENLQIWTVKCGWLEYNTLFILICNFLIKFSSFIALSNVI